MAANTISTTSKHILSLHFLQRMTILCCLQTLVPSVAQMCKCSEEEEMEAVVLLRKGHCFLEQVDDTGY